MPVDPKPLFRPDVLQAHLRNFEIPTGVEAARDDLLRWADLIGSGRISNLKERELLPDFLTLFFQRILGYQSPAEADGRWTISREHHVEVDGKYADAVLGDFRAGSPAKYVVALEGKGPKDPLDRPYAGRRMSAVDQGYRYAINLPCDWVIVTSMPEVRLYCKAANQHSYEVFDTARVACDEDVLRRFVYLLGAERVVPAKGECHLPVLYTESEQVGRELTRTFYGSYADIRQDIFQRLAADNPAVTRNEILVCTQRILDRVLFCAFCEDRGLLPPETLKKAYEHRDPYHPRPVWENFRSLFTSVDRGNAALGIHAYNGGLFAGSDPVFERLIVSDEVCGYFRELGAYDYRDAATAATIQPESGKSLIDVDILGHIFEQSISDLEKLRSENDDSLAAADSSPPEKKSRRVTRRKSEGVFYTPSFITRYIVEQALGGVVADRFEKLRLAHASQVKGAGKAALADPTVYDLGTLKAPARAVLVNFWEAWQDDLAGIRLLDPACGSGAFLIEAFDQMHAAYKASNDRLEELRGHRSLFDLDKRILENNIYGVDLNEEAVEICRLSLWIKTAQRGKPLTTLDDTIRSGNSIVADPAVHPRGFDWHAAFPAVFKDGGFDVVVGNPPYVRQELLSDIKPYLEKHYAAYHGMADLYVYFYELGLRVLKPGGLLSFIVTNKWMKAGYGEPLRKLLAETSWIESVVDFGHAKQIFEDADVFPSIVVARKPLGQAVKPKTARLCTIPRDQLRIDDLSRQITDEGLELSLDQLSSGAWQLEPAGVSLLLEKIRASRLKLAEVIGAEPTRGFVTGFNEAFLIDTPTRDRLMAADPRSAEVILKAFRGQDIDRWHSSWNGVWMVFTRHGIDIDQFPAIQTFLAEFRAQLEPKPKGWKGAWQGRASGNYKWYELQSGSGDSWKQFLQPKIVYQEIQFHPCYALDTSGCLMNNKVFMLPSRDLYLLGVLNAPLMWWHNWRYLPHMKDEALSPAAFLMKDLPIAEPTDEIRAAVTARVERLLEITASQHDTSRTLLDWLKVEHAIEKPTQRLQAFVDLDSDAFVAEVKKIRGKKNPLSAAAVKNLRDEFAKTVAPAQALAGDALELEHAVSDLVNAAYGLTPEEIDLMWETAPPRMPIRRIPVRGV